MRGQPANTSGNPNRSRVSQQAWTQPALPWPRLLPRFHEGNKLGDPLRPHLGTALGCVNPSQIVLPIKGREPIEKLRRLRLGGKRSHDIGGERIALWTLGPKCHIDRVAYSQAECTPVRGPQGQEVSSPELLQGTPHTTMIDSASNVVSRFRSPYLPWIERQDNVDTTVFAALELRLEGPLYGRF